MSQCRADENEQQTKSEFQPKGDERNIQGFGQQTSKLPLVAATSAVVVASNHSYRGSTSTTTTAAGSGK